MNRQKFKGSLCLDWINKEKSLYYDIDDEENRGIKPVWVERNDIRVSEPRIINFVKNIGNEDNDNMLIRGDNLLVLRTLVEQFKNRSEQEKVKCIYIDPPYNTGSAFEHYDDNLKHSEWLTMMRDRLLLLKKLLRKDGAIFVQIDDEELGYLKVLMDEIFGRENFVSFITIRRSAPTGHKAINPSPVNVCDYILFYSSDKKYWKYYIQYTKRDFDKAYSKFIINYDRGFENWSFVSLNSALKELGITLDEAIAKHPEKIIRFAQPNYEGVGTETRKLIDKSIKEKEKLFCQKREGYPDIYLYNGNRILFYKDKLKTIDGTVSTGEPLTNFWNDVPFQGISNEGDVTFLKSKKPEKLIKRILQICTQSGDLVLDSFAGSGTTGAVAHKMGRRWIMVELGKHAEDLCFKRLKSVVDGSDQSGISKEVNWKGGGGFKYYKLGESLITNKDINWNLTYKQIAEALFYTKNFKMLDEKELEKNNIFIGRNLNERGVYALCTVSKDCEFIKSDEYFELIEKIKEQHKFTELNIYTNKAVNVRKIDQETNVFIRKIPQTILKKYGLI